MNKKYEEAKENFNEQLENYNSLLKHDKDLENRLEEAEINISNLETEKEEIKQKRPALLADNEDVSEINKRLKEIDEEIELNKDTIIGIEAKRKEIQNNFAWAKERADKAYRKVISMAIQKAKKEYAKVAPKFAELLKDFMTLDDLYNRQAWGIETFSHEDIMRVPSLKDNSYLFVHNIWKVPSQNRNRVLEKYNIPKYL